MGLYAEKRFSQLFKDLSIDVFLTYMVYQKRRTMNK